MSEKSTPRKSAGGKSVRKHKVRYPLFSTLVLPVSPEVAGQFNEAQHLRGAGDQGYKKYNLDELDGDWGDDYYA